MAVTFAPEGHVAPVLGIVFTSKAHPRLSLLQYTDDRRQITVTPRDSDEHPVRCARECPGAFEDAMVSQVEADEHPEGLTVSPDGRWVAMANLEESCEPLNDPKRQLFASLSLWRFDASTGTWSVSEDLPLTACSRSLSYSTTEADSLRREVFKVMTIRKPAAPFTSGALRTAILKQDAWNWSS